MGTPSTSLIVSTFQQKWCAPAVFSSISNQRIKEALEVVVCDDGSSDNTFPLIAEWAARRNVNVRYIWQPDGGFRLSRSRNNAIRCAQGEVLLFIDGDTWIHPDFLEDHLSVHSGPEILGCGRRQKIVVEPGSDPVIVELALHLLTEKPIAKLLFRRNGYDRRGPGWRAWVAILASRPAKIYG